MCYIVPYKNAGQVTHRGREPMKQRRTFKKDAQLNMRMPWSDKERLEEQARIEKRQVSDLAWVIITDWLDQRQPRKGATAQ